MSLMFRKGASLFLNCLSISVLLSCSPGDAGMLESESSFSPSGTGPAATRIEPLVLAYADENAGKPVETPPAAADRRSGLTEFQEKALIVVIAILIAFVVAWKLAGRSQEDIQRLLNRSKSSSEPDEAGQKTETELATEIPQEVKSDTVPEIPAVSEEDTEHDIPASDQK